MNLEELKQQSSGQWDAIIHYLGGIDIDLLDGRQVPCPSGQCGSTKDAFRVFNDFAETGGMICNQCGKFADGIAAIQWLCKCDFKTAASKVAEYLGGEFTGKKKAKSASRKFKPPRERVTVLSAAKRESFARDFCKAKPGVDFDSLMKTRWAPCLWPRGGSAEIQVEVLAFASCRLPSLDEHSFILYRRDGKPFKAGDKIGSRPSHVLPGEKASGNQDGIVIVGSISEFRAAKIVYKCEGVTDALTLAQLLVAGEIAFANICGAESCSWAEPGGLDFDELRIVADNDPSGIGEIGAKKLAEVVA